KHEAMPAMTNDRATAGPALAAAARPVRTKMPVPMMAPIPSMTRSSAVSERLSPCPCSASARSSSTDLVAKSRFPILFSPRNLRRSRSILGCTAYLLTGCRPEQGECGVADHQDHENPHRVEGQRFDDKSSSQDCWHPPETEPQGRSKGIRPA